jgi:hypothetical protein
VLLDGDMETHNADFGIAKTIAFKPNDGYVNTTILEMVPVGTLPQISMN